VASALCTRRAGLKRRLTEGLLLLGLLGGCDGVPSMPLQEDASLDSGVDSGLEPEPADPSPVCGNGKKESGEQCDDGNRRAGDDCSSDCRKEEAVKPRPACGNGVLEAREQCDDANLEPGDGCDEQCRLQPECGNGLPEAGELCDPPNTDDCDETCAWRIEPPPPQECPNGQLDPGEDCDDDNFWNGDGCSTSCRFEVPIECGNGIVEAAAGEQCEPPGSNGCGEDCRYPIQPQCGNGNIETYLVTPEDAPAAVVVEQCDDGNATDDDGCSATCAVEIPEGCANGVVEPDLGEECDDGNFWNSDGCSTRCKEEVCGDGVVQSGEDCDDANFFAFDGCSTRCTIEGPPDPVDPVAAAHHCGNGVIDSGEECDDGNRENGDDCSAMCETGYCGDRSVEEDRGEECDDGLNRSAYGVVRSVEGIRISSTCAPLCKLPGHCGDGIRQYGYETCDDRNTLSGDGCSSLCEQESTCGNGKLEFDEQCDDNNIINGDDCSSTCVVEPPPNCGDGFFDPLEGEKCEDGNFVPGDGCSPACRPEVCGNGIQDPGEECETGSPVVDPTPDSLDAGPFWSWQDEYCNSECRKILYCGDEVTSPGEECDEGPLTDCEGLEDEEEKDECEAQVAARTCTEECTFVASCGDGHLDTGEECDDRNQTAGDGCDATCKDEGACGDATPDPTEQCDDGNVQNGDGCSSMCRVVTVVPGGTASGIQNGKFDSNTDPWQKSQATGVALSHELLDADGSPSSGSLGVSNTVHIAASGAALVTNAATQCRPAVPGAERSLIGEAYIDVDQPASTRAGAWVRFFASGDCTGVILSSVELSDAADRGTWIDIGGAFTVPGGAASMLIWLKATKSYDSPEALVLYDNIGLVGPGGLEEPPEPQCGDGVVQLDLGEDCDDDNVTDGDGCSRFCRDEVVCGDGIRDTTELCDDGNVDNNDSCSVNCTPSPVCGNRAVEAGEECDDDLGAHAGDGCSSLCQLEVFCGNEVVEAQEQCDDGNAVSDDGCSSHCLEEPVCGNGTRERQEECDDGNLVSNDGCSQLCTEEHQQMVRDNCGDGIVQSFAWYVPTPFPAPTPPPVPVPVVANPELPLGICGNTVKENGEACDDGNRDAHDGCDPYCQLEPSLCGNGVTQTGEQCDDGNRATGDACDEHCRTTICGNKKLESRESCDDGNLLAGDGCSPTCTFEAEVCEYPPGSPGNAHCRPGSCTPSCSACQTDYFDQYAPLDNRSCESVGVACLDATGAAADGPAKGRPRRELCQELFTCIHESNIATSGAPVNCYPEGGDPVSCLCKEEGGQTGAARTAKCFADDPAFQGPCGDEFLAAAETSDRELALLRLLEPEFVLGTALELAECTDMNCAAACEVTCGNGYVEGTESCDDSNSLGGDGCSESCVVEICGDGKLDTGEGCDWANPAQAAVCKRDCSVKRGCGDGCIEGLADCSEGAGGAGGGGTGGAGGTAFPPEECDDRNVLAGDGCNASCKREYCGDGVWQPNLVATLLTPPTPPPTWKEECDDGNAATGDGCKPDCMRELGCDECAELRCGDEWMTCAEFASHPRYNGTPCDKCSDDDMEAMAECMVEEECVVLTGDPNTPLNVLGCYCPAGMNALDCGGWDPSYPTPTKGLCYDEFAANFVNDGTCGPAKPGHVMFQLVDIAYPGGAVLNWYQCRYRSCGVECGQKPAP
jgi:cysteine-rich repeat protein